MMLKGNTTLKELYLGGCGLEPEGLEEVMKGVQANTKLETLDLSENIIDNKRASCIVGPDISCDEDEDVADVDTVCTIKTVSLQLDPTDPGTMAKESAKDPVIANGSRVIIPSILRPQILQLLHLGHFGIQRMKQLARTAVYLPRIDADIMDLFHQCTAKEFQSWFQERGITYLTGAPMISSCHQRGSRTSGADLQTGSFEVLTTSTSSPSGVPDAIPPNTTGRQIRTKIDVVLPSPVHIAQGKQAQAATTSQECELPNKVVVTYNVGSPCYALYYGPRREKDTRWVLAVVTKRFGTCSVNVWVVPRGGTWRRHVEQLRPRYVDQEDTDPGPVQIQTMEPVVSLQEATLLADGAPTPAMAQMPVLVPPPVRKAQTHVYPHNPRRSSRQPISRKPEHNTTLSELWLRECGLKDEAICELCGGLKWCRLKILVLNGNPFGDQGAKGLADVLKDHPTLEALYVWGCEEMSDDGVQHLMDAMMSNTRVKKLGLPRNLVSDLGGLVQAMGAMRVVVAAARVAADEVVVGALVPILVPMVGLVQVAVLLLLLLAAAGGSAATAASAVGSGGSCVAAAGGGEGSSAAAGGGEGSSAAAGGGQ
eukprot:Em0270g1a